jgi:predicted RND superfamily exporter protein
MAGESAPKAAGAGRKVGLWERVGRRLAGFLYAHRWGVVVGALLLTGLAAVRVPDLLSNIRVNRGALQDPQNPVRKRFDQVVGQFGTPFLATVVLEGTDRTALHKTADGIARVLSTPPAERKPGDDPCNDPRLASRQVRGVFYTVDLKQFEKKGIYYLSVDQLKKLGEGLDSADREGSSVMPPLTSLQVALNGIADGITTGQQAAGGDDAKDAESVSQLVDALGRLDRWLDKPYPEERLSESAAPKLSADDRRGVDDAGYFSQGENPIRMFVFVRPVSDSEDEKDNRCFTNAVRAVAHGEAARVARESGTPVRALVTGMPAVVTDEMTMIARDAGRVTIFSGAAIFLLLLLYYRSLRTAIFLLVPLLFALFWTLGLVSITIGRLTLISAYFGGVLMGLGVDYAVQIFQRYNLERLAGRSQKEAAELTLGQTGGAILTAAVMTTMAFLGIGMTDFLGFAELGQIVAMAIWMIFLATIFILPVLMFWFHKPRAYGFQAQRGLHGLARHRLARVPILVVTFGVIAFGGFSLKDARLDWDAMNLLPGSAESVLGTKALAHTDYSADTAIVTASSSAQMRERVAKLEQLAAGAGRGNKDDDCAAQRPVVARIESAGRYERLLPEMSEAKVEAVVELRRHREFLDKIRQEAADAVAAPAPIEPARIAEALERIADEAGNLAFDMKENKPDSPLTKAIAALAERSETLAARIRGADPKTMTAGLEGFQQWLLGELSGGLVIVLAGLDLPPLEVRALPPDIDARFRSRDGKSFATYVYPTGNIGSSDFLPCFAADLRSVDPGATGFPMTHLANASEIESSFRTATLYAFIAVLLSLIIYMRNPWHVIVTLVPLLFGGMTVVSILWLRGSPFNFVDVMALPVLLCTGVDYGVYLVHRYRENPQSVDGFASVSAGVMLCALTTIIGFAFLMISDHVGMWSLGFALSIGITACWIGAQLAVPALLFFRERRPGAAEAQAPAGGDAGGGK